MELVRAQDHLWGPLGSVTKTNWASPPPFALPPWAPSVASIGSQTTGVDDGAEDSLPPWTTPMAYIGVQATGVDDGAVWAASEESKPNLFARVGRFLSAEEKVMSDKIATLEFGADSELTIAYR